MKKLLTLLFLVIFTGILTAQDLGGGYKNTKWGMTYKEVKKILSKDGYKLYDEYENKNYSITIHTYEYYDKDGRDTVFLFQDNKLYAVIYKPFHFTRGATKEKGLKIVEELANKYGEDYEIIMQPGDLCDIQSFCWEDEVTQIRCDMWTQMHPVVNYDDRIMIVYLNKAMSDEYENLKKKSNQDRMDQEEESILSGL